MATLGHRKKPDPCSPCRVTGMLGVQGEGGPPASLGGAPPGSHWPGTVPMGMEVPPGGRGQAEAEAPPEPKRWRVRAV